MDTLVSRIRPQAGKQVMFIEHNFIYTTSKPGGDVEKVLVVQSSCPSNKKTILDTELQIWSWHTETGMRVSVHGHGYIMAVVGQLH